MAIFDPLNVQILVIGDPQMTFGRIWRKTRQIFAFFTPKMGIFDFPNMQILVIGDPHMTFGGIWSKTNFVYNFWHFYPQMVIFDPLNILQILVMGKPQITFWCIWSTAFGGVANFDIFWPQI